MRPADMAERLRAGSPDLVFARDEVTIVNQVDGLLATLEHLRGHEDLSFDFLSDLTATDWPDREPRFWLAYHLLSTRHDHRVRVKVGLPGDDPRAPSVTGLYPTANWHEREVFDFFGVIFDGHPDLRRIELPDEWEVHPLRKDHELGGVRTQYRGAFIPPPDQRGL